jgi:hypothetical protein
MFHMQFQVVDFVSSSLKSQNLCYIRWGIMVFLHTTGTETGQETEPSFIVRAMD